MKKRIITEKILDLFEKHLIENEKAEATRRKYLRDIRHFADFAYGDALNKGLLIEYKSVLEQIHTVRSANSMLAAVNAFLRFAGWSDLCVKQFKLQTEAYCSEDKELTKAEYVALIKTAEKNKNERLSLVVQTICSTGIRVSELENITLEAVKHGEAVVSCKGKTRKIFIVKALRTKLLQYAAKKDIF